MSRIVVCDISPDTLYYLLQYLPPRTIAVLTLWNGSYHDSMDMYHISFKKSRKPIVLEALRTIRDRGLIPEDEYERTVEAIKRKPDELEKKLLRASRFMRERDFLSNYSWHREREITAIDRSLRVLRH